MQIIFVEQNASDQCADGSHHEQMYNHGGEQNHHQAITSDVERFQVKQNTASFGLMNNPAPGFAHPNHPQKSVDQFETDARVKTNAASLVIYGDAIPIEVSDVVSGDFNDNKKHTMVVRDQYENEDVTPGSTPFSYGNLDNGYTSDPLEGTIGLTEKAWPINPNKPNMFRFKELANAPAPPAQVPITPSSGGSSVSPVVIPQQRDSTECPFCH